MVSDFQQLQKTCKGYWCEWDEKCERK
jgi:hypothetical protein